MIGDRAWYPTGFAGYEFGVFAVAGAADDSLALTIRWPDRQLGIELQQSGLRHEAAIKKFGGEAAVLLAMDKFATTVH